MIPHGSIDRTHAPRRRADLVAVELDGETVLYDPATGGMHRLNVVATVLWRCFDGTATLAELEVDLRSVLPSTDGVEGDLLVYARRLGGLGLLEGVRADSPPG